MPILFLIFIWFSITSEFSSWCIEVNWIILSFISNHFLFISFRNNHRSPSPVKFIPPIVKPVNTESDGEIDDDDEHRLNIDDSKEQNITMFEHEEQSSDDEQVRIDSKEGARSRTRLNVSKMDKSLPSSHSPLSKLRCAKNENQTTEIIISEPFQVTIVYL